LLDVDSPKQFFLSRFAETAISQAALLFEVRSAKLQAVMYLHSQSELFSGEKLFCLCVFLTLHTAMDEVSFALKNKFCILTSEQKWK
jgi:hypothetical protein